MKRALIVYAGIGMLLCAASWAGTAIDVKAPNLPEEVLAYMEVPSLSGLDKAIGEFAGGAGLDSPRRPMAVRLATQLAQAYPEATMRLDGALRAFVFAPLDRTSIVGVIPVKDASGLIEALKQRGMKPGPTQDGMSSLLRERRQFDREAYQKATAEEKRNFQQFMKTVEETYYVADLGDRAAVGQDSAQVAQVVALLKEKNIVDDALITGQGHVAYFARPKTILTTPDNPIAKMRKMITQQLAARPGQEAVAGILDAEFELLEGLGKELESSAVAVHVDGLGIRLTLECQTVKVGDLEKYMQSVPEGAPALQEYLRSDAGFAMATRLGDMAPVMEWYPDFMKTMMASSGQDPAQTEEMARSLTDYVSLMGSDMAFSFSFGQTMQLVEAFTVKDAKAVRDLMEKNTKLSSGMNFSGFSTQMTYERDVANHKGTPIDRMSIQYGMTPEAKEQAPQMAGFMDTWIGILNSFVGSIHLASAEKLVVLTAGADSLADLQKVLDNEITPLSESKSYQDLMDVLPDDAFAIGYVSATSLANGGLDFVKRMMGPNAPQPIQQIQFESGPGIGMTGRRADGSVVLDVWVPALEIRRIVEGVKSAQQGGQPGAGNVPPQPAPQ